MVDYGDSTPPPKPSHPIASGSHIGGIKQYYQLTENSLFVKPGFGCRWQNFSQGRMTLSVLFVVRTHAGTPQIRTSPEKQKPIGFELRRLDLSLTQFPKWVLVWLSGLVWAFRISGFGLTSGLGFEYSNLGLSFQLMPNGKVLCSLQRVLDNVNFRRLGSSVCLLLCTNFSVRCAPQKGPKKSYLRAKSCPIAIRK